MRQEKIAVALYGFPGSGKGTQANLIANMFGLVNFDTGKHLESIWYDPKRQKDPSVRKERELFASGKLNTPSFVLNEVRRELEKTAKRGLGIVYSGSPRTMFEAEGLIPLMERLYGKRNVFFFFLDVDPKDSVARNGSRLLCTKCKFGLMAKYYPAKRAKYCPVCAGPLYKRTLDDLSVIPKRIVEYKERTAPILGFLKKRGNKVVRLNGRQKPYEVFAKIESSIKKIVG